MTSYPNYLEMRQPLPQWAWHVLGAATIASAFALIAVLFVEPRTGLIAWWLFILPVLPLLWLLAPGIWRNVCPMATLNQYPRLFGFTRGKTVPPWLRQNAFLIQIVLYFALISTRAPVFDHNGRAVGVLLLVALVAAFAGGVVFKGKSGWCGTFCPLLPVQRLYGQTPAVAVPNSHCRPCVGCIKNCYDFNPHVAFSADAYDEDARYAGERKLFAGAFPGFVLAFFTLPDSPIAAPADLGMSVADFYLQTGLYMLASLGIFFLLDALALVSPVVLMAVFAAAALNIHNVLRFPTAFDWDKPDWILGAEYVLVACATAVFLVRTYQKDRRLTQEEEPMLAVRPAVPARTATGETHEVAIDPPGRRVVVTPGTTLLEVVEKADLAVEPGCRMGVCGADPVRVLAGGDALSGVLPEERATLARLGLGGDCRMACCARVLGDVRVSLDVSGAAPAAPPLAVDYDRSVRRVVILGNGIAGVTAADHVRRLHPDCEIDVIAEELHPLYNRMAISRLIYGRSAMGGLHLLPDQWYSQNRVGCWLNTQAHEIDRNAGVVVLGTGERLQYDRLVLAMGSSASLPPLEGIEREGVFVVRRADDATGLRAFAQRHHARRAIVAGGGLLGIEAAHALHQLGLRVRVVEPAPRLMARQLDQRGSDLLLRYLQGLGLAVELEVMPDSIDDEGLKLADGRTFPLDLLVVCAGIRPNADLAAACGLDVRRGVVVDERMRTSDPAIFAAGDVAEFDGEIHGLWPTAVAQAEIAAANAVGVDRVYERTPPVAVLKGVGLEVTSIGAVEAEEGDEVLVDEDADGSFRYGKLVIREGRLAGAVLVGKWPGQAALVAAVASGRDVSAELATLRDGDWAAVAA